MVTVLHKKAEQRVTNKWSWDSYYWTLLVVWASSELGFLYLESQSFQVNMVVLGKDRTEQLTLSLWAWNTSYQEVKSPHSPYWSFCLVWSIFPCFMLTECWWCLSMYVNSPQAGTQLSIFQIPQGEVRVLLLQHKKGVHRPLLCVGCPGACWPQGAETHYWSWSCCFLSM